MNARRTLGSGVAALAFALLLFGGHAQSQELATPAAGPTPTLDRLAAPPTVPSPTQADEGAQLFWLYCQPCHGDRGQGLTDEWREQFPVEEQNCWQSGCHGTHGKDAPEFGFVLPTAVPPVTGAGALSRFADAGQLYAFIRAAMPYENPGRLSDAEALAITAFLVRAHDRWDGATLTEETIALVALGAPTPAAPAPAGPAPAGPAPAGPAPAVTPPPPAPVAPVAESLVPYAAALALLASVGLGALFLQRRGRR